MAALAKSNLLKNVSEPELLGFRARIAGIYGLLVSANVAAWIWSFIAFAHQPVLMGTAVLAYSLGLRHAIEDIDALLHRRGWLARLFRPLFRLVAKSWHLFPIGLLFALGFETASEIGLFGLSARASNSVSSWSLLIFPALFAAGMTLVDTTDGVLMLGAYGWAYRNPLRKLFYNLTITSVSVLVALVVGGIETLGLIADQFQLRGKFWVAISDLNDNFGALGYGIVALFIVSWGTSFLVYRFKRCDLYVRLE